MLSSMSLKRMSGSMRFTNRANAQCGLRVELYDMLKLSCQGTGIFRIIQILLRFSQYTMQFPL